jgi:predicted MFS family arabinose efflux permease
MAIGSFGLAASLGATFNTSLAGWIADRFGLRMAFLTLAAAGAVALLVVLFIMPETRPADESLEAGPKARPA